MAKNLNDMTTAFAGAALFGCCAFSAFIEGTARQSAAAIPKRGMCFTDSPATRIVHVTLQLPRTIQFQRAGACLTRSATRSLDRSGQRVARGEMPRGVRQTRARAVLR